MIPGLSDDSGADPAPEQTAPASQETGAQVEAPEAPEAPDVPAAPGPAGFEQSEITGIADVLFAIEAGEELPYSEDGQTFQNREGLLPSQPLGYYREYTVETPGSPDRGARRLVIGDAGETYYTRDHYSSFERIEPGDFQQ